MAFDAHKNFAYGVVATQPSPSTTGTSITLQSGQGALQPTPPFNATVWPIGVQPTTTNAEIVRVTAISGDSLTIIRTQENSLSRSITVGDQFANSESSKVFTDIENVVTSTASLVTNLAPLNSPVFTGTPIVPTATTGTNTNQAASTAFVIANAASGSTPATFINNGTVKQSIYNVRDFGAVGDGTTDDTAAFQNAINAAGNNTNVKILVPPAVSYNVGTLNNTFGSPIVLTVDISGISGDCTSLLQAISSLSKTPGSFVKIYLPPFINLTQQCIASATGRSAQIVLPYIPTPDTANKQSYLEWVGIGRGEGPSPTNSVTADGLLSPGGTIIKSTGVSPISGTIGSVIDSAGSTGNFSLLNFTMHNFVLQVDANPTLNGLRLREVSGVRGFGAIRVEAQESGGLAVQPTNNTIGVDLPAESNNGGATFDELYVQGFAQGTTIAEHTVINSLAVHKCLQAIVVQHSYHAATINYASLEWCTNHIVPETLSGAGPFTPFVIFMADFEKNVNTDMSWYANVYNVNDASNALFGNIGWNNVFAGTGRIHTLLLNGAANITFTEVGSGKVLGQTLLSTQIGLGLPVLSVTQNDTSNNPSAITVTQNTSGNGITINQVGVGSSVGPALSMTGGGAGHAMQEMTFTGTTGGGNNVGGINVGSTTATTASAINASWNSPTFTGVAGLGVANISQNNASASGNLMKLTNAGTGNTIIVNSSDMVLKTNPALFGIGTNNPTASIDAPASTTANASVRIRSGVAPTSPNNGDLWYDGSHLQFKNVAGINQIDQQTPTSTTGSGATVLANSPTISGLTDSGTANERVTIQSTGANQLAGLQIIGRLASANYLWTVDARGGVDTPNNRFAIQNNTGSEKLSILPGGNVGIGNSNPTYTLDVVGNIGLKNIGSGLRVMEGTNAKQGIATLAAGTVTVANSSVTTSSRIFLTVQSLGTVTTPTAVAVTSRAAGSSFTITSETATDTSVVAYEIFEPY